MSIKFNVFQAGLNGGTKVSTGDRFVPKVENGNIQGFVVVKNCFISSVLNESGAEVVTNVMRNNEITNILNLALVKGDVISPVLPSTFFTRVTIKAFSNLSQIILYTKK